MRVTFWGVRGSIPAPGREFNRYGGNTPCVALHSESGALLVLDAGTGIIELGNALIAQEFGKGEGSIDLFLTHAHWDHIQGFPFFAPVYVPGNSLTIHGASGSTGMLEGIFEGQMNPHYNPVQSLRNLGATIAFAEAEEGVATTIHGVEVTARPNPHGQISALAYRFREGGRSLVYAPDAGYHDDWPSAETRELYRGADYLIHDCTYTPEDRRGRESRGYCSIDIAARVAAACQVKRLVMFHYDQDYTDEEVDRLAARCRELLDEAPGGGDVELIAAREGLTLDV